MDTKQTYYNHTLLSDKFFFGGYFNLAENNINLVFNAYKERFREKGNVINKLKDTKLSDSDFNLRTDYLSRHLPFIHYLSKTNRQEFCESIDLLIKAVNRLRNFYTHYFHKPMNFDERFYDILDELLLKVIKNVRKDRLKTDETKILLKIRLKKELEILYKIQKDKLLEEKKKGKKIFLDNESIKTVFIIRLFIIWFLKTRIQEKSLLINIINQNQLLKTCLLKMVLQLARVV